MADDIGIEPAYEPRAMHALRAFLFRHRAIAAILIAAALAMKALIPAGYMLDEGGRTLTVGICADSSLGKLTRQIAIPAESQSHGGQGEHAKTDGTCAFSILSFGSLSAVDPALLAIALLFILALGFVSLAAPPVVRRGHLRPPLRGPPALI